MGKGRVRQAGFLTKIDKRVVDIVDVYSTREDEVGGVRWGEEGDICVCKLDSGRGGSNVSFINLIEWGPGKGRGGRGGHLMTVSSNIGRLF